MRELVDANRKEIASLISKEHGKVLGDALGEVARGLENIEFACGIPNLLKGGYSEQASTGVDVYSIKQPLGVVAGITPFNFPGMVPMWMFANALACGNTFVLKPSEKDPSTSMLIGELLKQAGLPDGCFNVVNGDKVAVDRILEHPDIAAVSFVGSTPIAKYIYETGTKNGKRVQALGGAKNHMLVLPDADLDMAADAAVSAAYGSAGERCMAISVVLASESIADALVDKIKDRIPAIKVGPASESESEMGPLITGEHRDKVAGYIGAAEGEGATLVVDGRQDAPGGGFFLKPSLIDHAKFACAFVSTASAFAIASDSFSACSTDDLPILDIDTARIREVISNLLTNGLRHTPPDGRVELAAVLAGDQVEVTVHDTGSGIPADQLERIFDRFYRSPDSPGSGLGLPIAKSLIEAHDGTITATSQAGGGATIRVTLPRAGLSAP